MDKKAGQHKVSLPFKLIGEYFMGNRQNNERWEISCFLQSRALGVDAHVAAPLTRKVWAAVGQRWAETSLGRPLVFGQH